MQRARSGTARRLFVAFAGLVSVFAVSSFFALQSLREIHDGVLRMTQYEEGVRTALELASAVRDQYAHQAHTIILGNDSHLSFYADAERKVRHLTALVANRARSADERQWVRDIEIATTELDEIFRASIVPAVLRGSAADVQEEHGRAQVVVTLIQDRADRLVDRFEASIGAVEAHVVQVQHVAFRWTVFFLVGAPALAAAVGVFVFRSVARPVAKLQAGAARLAEGDLRTRIDVDSPDEFGDLARQFNVMTSALKEHQERLVHSEKLAGIGRLAAGVAHEINNPLAVILGYLKILRKDAEGQLSEDLRVVEEEAIRAKEIVEGLLDLSRPLGVRPEVVDLRALSEETVTRLRDAKQLDGVRLSVEGEGRVDGDPQKLRQVLLNLIRNATEAAGRGGEVRVRVDRVDGGVELSVADSGPGLGVEAQERLFEPFFTTKPRGTGLGLAVSKGIVHAHGGEIEVRESSLGGAQFTMRLPGPRAGET